MRYQMLFVLILCIAYNASGQVNDNAFRNAGNSLYWRNRMPDKDYWQQDVQYYSCLDLQHRSVHTLNVHAYAN